MAAIQSRSKRPLPAASARKHARPQPRAMARALLTASARAWLAAARRRVRGALSESRRGSRRAAGKPPRPGHGAAGPAAKPPPPPPHTHPSAAAAVGLGQFGSEAERQRLGCVARRLGRVAKDSDVPKTRTCRQRLRRAKDSDVSSAACGVARARASQEPGDSEGPKAVQASRPGPMHQEGGREASLKTRAGRGDAAAHGPGVRTAWKICTGG